MSCKEGNPNGVSTCGWKIRASEKAHGLWEMVVWNDRHTCVSYANENDNRNVNSSIIAALIVKKIEKDPDYKVKLIQDDVKKHFKVDIKYKKGWHSRRKAIEMCWGDWPTNFAELPRYMAALESSNPNTVVQWEWQTGWTNQSKVFKYVFWAFGPSIETFHDSPPVVSVDGTHLRGQYKGKLIVAITKTANKRILPIAFALVDTENEESWTFFMKNLRLFVVKDRYTCIISDRHAGLLSAMRKMPEWSDPHTGCHRYCLRHVRSNLMTKHKSAKVRRLCWEMGGTCQIRKFDKSRADLGSFKEAALQYLDRIPKKRWTLAHDTNQRRWGNLTTNISESYNNVLKGARYLPIRALVESTFAKTVELFVSEYRESSRCDTVIPPENWKDFTKYDKVAGGHTVEYYDQANYIFKVTTFLRPSGKGNNIHTVNYPEKSCTCGKWQTYRSPCSHAIAVCRTIRGSVVDMFSPLHKTTTWRKQFQNGRFNPVPQREYWPMCGWNLVPDYTNLVLYGVPGRRQKRRFLNEMDYAGRRRRGECRRCGSQEHTTNVCPRSHRRADRTRIEKLYDPDGVINE